MYHLLVLHKKQYDHLVSFVPQHVLFYFKQLFYQFLLVFYQILSFLRYQQYHFCLLNLLAKFPKSAKFSFVNLSNSLVAIYSLWSGIFFSVSTISTILANSSYTVFWATSFLLHYLAHLNEEEQFLTDQYPNHQHLIKLFNQFF